MLHTLRSKLRILKSKIPILCTSLLSNILCEKFSIGPLLWMNSYREPIFRFEDSDRDASVEKDSFSVSSLLVLEMRVSEF